MRHFRLLSFVMFSLVGATTTLADETPDLLPRCGQTDFNLCGFIDAKIWRDESRTVFIIEPKYESVGDFSNGLAAVQIAGKYGYIDESGNLMIAPQFDAAGIFQYGLAVAGGNDVLGVIDQSGKYVVEPAFSNAVIFNEQIILAVPNKIDVNLEQDSTLGGGSLTLLWGSSFPRSYSFERLNSITGAGIYSVSKGWLTDQKYTFERFSGPEDKLIWAQVPMGKPGTWDDDYGLMRMDGSWLIEPQYRYAQELKYNRAIVRKIIGGENLSGAIDKDGREVIPFVFDYLTYWDANFLQAGEGDYPNRNMGLVTFDGKLLGGRYFDEIQRPKRGLEPNHPLQEFYTVKDGGEWKTLTKDGVLLSDQRVGQTFLECEQFMISYDVQGYVLIPKDNSLPKVTFEKPRFPYTNRKCSPPPTLVQGDSYAAVLENGKVFGGFFESSKGFFGPRRWVRVDGKWGLVDADGDFSVEPIYTSVAYEGSIRGSIKLPKKETDETYKVIKNDEAYRLSFVEGKYEEKPFAELPKDVSKVLNCKGNYQRKSKNGLWGIVDENGEDLIPAQYRAITCFSSGVAWVPDDTKRQWCPLDRDNRVRSAPSCKKTVYTYYGSHRSPEEFDDDPYESSVLWMKALLDYGEGRRDEEPRIIPWDD